MAVITVVVAGRGQRGRAECLRLLQHRKGIRVVGEARSELEILAAVGLEPRVLLLDLNVLPRGAVPLLRALARRSRWTKVVLLTYRTSESLILDALSHGARGYLEKTSLRAFLPKAVRKVDAGEAWVPRRMVAKLVERLA